MTIKEYEIDKNKTYEKVKIRELINFNDDLNEEVKVSVVIPIFNVETYLEECLDSILNQSLKEIEIVCVNDGSTDSSLEIIKKYASKDKRVKIINKENAGYGHTMNIGMDLASGKYIVIVESDDYILENMLETLYNKAEENDLDFVKSDYYRFFGEKDSIIKSYFRIDNTGLLYNKLLCPADDHKTYKILMNTWTGLYKTSFLRENNIRHNETPGASYQDNGFWFKTFFFGKRVMIVPEAFYMYRRDNPNSSVKNKSKVYAMDKEYELIHDFLKKNNKTKEYKDAYTYAKYHNFHFTVNRIKIDFKKEFLKNTVKGFEEMIEADEFDPSLLDEPDKHILNWIIDDVDNYYKYMYTVREENYEYLEKFLECRLDIKNYGTNANDIMIIDCDDSLCSITQPNWFNDNEGIGSIITSIKNELNISFKCINDGTLNIAFRAMDLRDRQANRSPIYIDYNEITINDENLVTGSIVAWHDNPYYYTREVKDGEIINLTVKWLPLNQESNLKVRSDYDTIYDTVLKSRIDIINRNNRSNNIIIKEHTCGVDVDYPSWFEDESGKGVVLFNQENYVDLTFECVNDGWLSMAFKSIDLRDKQSNRIPIFINYSEIIINDETILSDDVVTWHDNPYVYGKEVKDKEIINLKVKWHVLNNYKTIKEYYKKDEDRKEIEVIQEKINSLKAENEDLNNFTESILNSNSWKITEPLRKIKHLKK